MKIAVLSIEEGTTMNLRPLKKLFLLDLAKRLGLSAQAQMRKPAVNKAIEALEAD